MLETIDLTQKMTKKEYSDKLLLAQANLRKTLDEYLEKGNGLVLVFEGWDAAGKGGAIKRVTEKLDPRTFDLHGIAKPTEEEYAHHYLWRFWKRIPPLGSMVIFDRSWYGRVMVERVEGFASEKEWKRAYQEINEFEAQLTHHGIKVLKFFLHVSQEEQLKRFEERKKSLFKTHKITDEDWRNREKFPQYLEAYQDMFLNNNTMHAPWFIVPGENKYFARLHVIDTIIENLKEKKKNKD